MTEMCAWCGRRIEWTETFAAVAPPRWVHMPGGLEYCYSMWGVHWAAVERSAEDETMRVEWSQHRRRRQLASMDWSMSWFFDDEEADDEAETV